MKFRCVLDKYGFVCDFAPGPDASHRNAWVMLTTNVMFTMDSIPHFCWCDYHRSSIWGWAILNVGKLGCVSDSSGK